jgi:hypothetical protein
MGPITRLVIGIIALEAAQVLIGGTAVCFLRRRKQVEPTWSWPRSIGAFFVLGLLAAGAGLVFLVGAFLLMPLDRSLVGLVAAVAPLAMVAVYLVGLKRSTGLDVLGTIFLSLGIGFVCLVVTVVLSKVLGVDLLSLQMGEGGPPQ